MLESLHPDIKMYIDKFCIENVKICMEGWVGSSKLSLVSLSLQINDHPFGKVTYFKPRPDVYDYFKRQSMGFLNCGFQFEENLSSPTLMGETLSLFAHLASGIKVHLRDIALAPTQTLPVSTVVPFAIRSPVSPGVIIVEDFYNASDSILQQMQRTQTYYHPENIKTAFERLLGKQINNWDHPANGTLQAAPSKEGLAQISAAHTFAAAVVLLPGQKKNRLVLWKTSYVNIAWQNLVEAGLLTTPGAACHVFCFDV